MEHTPRVSVVIPTYNRELELRRAIRSVLSQTFEDFEVIVVDDASAAPIESSIHAFEDARIRYYRKERNTGIAISRNIGMLMARGEYIAFLDDDDEYLAEFLEETVRTFDGAPPAVAFTWCGVVHMNSTPDGAIAAGRELWNPDPIDTPVRALYTERRFGTSRGFAFKRACLAEVGLFDPMLRTAEDTDLFLRMTRTHQFRVVPKYLVRYYSHSGPRIGTPSLARAEAYELITARNEPYLRGIPAARAHMHFVTAKLFYGCGVRSRGRRHLLTALLLSPLQSAHWKCLIVGEFMGGRQSRRRRMLRAILRKTKREHSATSEAMEPSAAAESEFYSNSAAY